MLSRHRLCTFFLSFPNHQVTFFWLFDGLLGPSNYDQEARNTVNSTADVVSSLQGDVTGGSQCHCRGLQQIVNVQSGCVYESSFHCFITVWGSILVVRISPQNWVNIKGILLPMRFVVMVTRLMVGCLCCNCLVQQFTVHGWAAVCIDFCCKPQGLLVLPMWCPVKYWRYWFGS